MSLIQDKLQILTLFRATWGSNGGQKLQTCQTCQKNLTKTKKLHRWIDIFCENLILSLIFYKLQFLSFFGTRQGSNWGQKRSKFTHLVENNPEMPHALVDLFFLKSDGITIFGKILYSNTLQSPPDPMGSKDTPIRKYVCV